MFDEPCGKQRRRGTAAERLARHAHDFRGGVDRACFRAAPAWVEAAGRAALGVVRRRGEGVASLGGSARADRVRCVKPARRAAIGSSQPGGKAAGAVQ